MKSKRSSNIELFRIVCMFMLVMHHFLVHGGLAFMANCTNRSILFALVPLGKICFNCFVAISCWFLVKSEFKGIRFVKVWLQILFYNVVISIVVRLMPGGDAIVSSKTIFGGLFPMIGNSHGFAAAYLAFYLLLPFLKMIQGHLDRKRSLLLIWILTMTQTIVPVIGYYIEYKQPLQSEFLLFVLIYFIAFYLQNWPIKFLNSQATKVIILGVLMVFIVVPNVMALYISNPFLNFLLGVNYTEFSIPNIVAGILLFQIVNNIRMPYNKAINTIATTTFGILLFHDHNYLRPVLWSPFKSLFVWESLSVPMFLGVIVIVSVCVFLIGMTVDIIRQICFETWILKTKFVRNIAAFLDSIVGEKKID